MHKAFKGVSTFVSRVFLGVLWLVQGCFKCISRLLLKGVSKAFQLHGVSLESGVTSQEIHAKSDLSRGTCHKRQVKSDMTCEE